MMDKPTIEDSLCDALLTQFGLAGTPYADRSVDMPLTDARNLVRHQAKEIITDLDDDGFVIVEAGRLDDEGYPIVEGH